MSKQILLINPPVSIYLNKTAFVPLPLLILGTCLRRLREEGLDFSYELLDLDLMLKRGDFSDDSSFYRRAGDLILSKEPDILLFTIHGLNHIVALKLAERIKRERPSSFIVAGGVGPTLMAEEAIERCPNIDAIVVGEGEPAIKRLIPAALNDSDFSNVPSLVYRKNGVIQSNPRQYLGTSEPIPAPDYSLLRVEDYISHNRTHPYVHPGFVLIESGRGCPHRCSFCAPAKMWEGKVRYRPVPEIIDEMKFLAARGGNFSFFTQDNLTEDFLRSLSEALIREQTGILWGCYARLDPLSEDMAGLLSDAGCRLIFTGFETPNRKDQKAIRKVIDTSSLFEKMQRFNARKIQFIGSFIAGFPGETEEDLEETLRFTIECSTGMRTEELDRFLGATAPEKLPAKSRNICLVHPLFYMPGSDDFNKVRGDLHISRYSLHPDCYGSYLFSYEEFKDDRTFLGGNPYLNYLPEDKVRYYCSLLRIFNFLNSRPFHFALLLSVVGQKPLGLLKSMVADMGEEFALTATIEPFEAAATAYVRRYLEFVPEWTVKKGQ